MQDQSHRKPSFQQALENGQADSLRRNVYHLAVNIGPRNIYHYEALLRAADHIETSFRDAGYTPLLHSYKARGKSFANISAELPGGSTKMKSSSSGPTTTRTRTLQARMTVGRPWPHFSNWRAILCGGRRRAHCVLSLSPMKRAHSRVVRRWAAVSTPMNAGDVETTSSA